MIGTKQESVFNYTRIIKHVIKPEIQTLMNCGRDQQLSTNCKSF